MPMWIKRWVLLLIQLLVRASIQLKRAMHLFLRQYEKMQFDRDSEESYQEKRMKLGGIVLKANLPMEIHASQIYTRTMFEKFGEVLYEGGS